jgi:GNAT superfamily N-acetyltransferase
MPRQLCGAQALPGFTVRVGRASDAEGVRRLAEDLTVAFPFDHKAFEPSYASVLTNPMATLLVAELDEHTVGYLLGYCHSTFWAGADIWWVEELFVEVSYQRSGIGQRLIEPL